MATAIQYDSLTDLATFLGRMHLSWTQLFSKHISLGQYESFPHNALMFSQWL